METFTPKTFNIGSLAGVGSKNIEEHLKLYKGYVNNTNLIINKIKEYSTDTEKNSYIISELNRRFAFEFDGMRNHEYFFSSLENGSKSLPEMSVLKNAIEKEWGSFEIFLEKFKATALTRGIGWAMLFYDKQSNHLFIQWTDEQHLGHLTGCSPILCLDMWEHAFVYDFATSEKKSYVEAFFTNLNWEVIEENFKKVI